MIEFLILIGWVMAGILPFIFLMIENGNEPFTAELIGVYAVMALLGPMAGILCLISWHINKGEPDDPR